MQGLRAPLSQEDIQFFSQLDNLFEYDLKNAPAQWEVCAGGRDNCFIDWKGDMYACPRSRVKIGNFYQGDGAVVQLSWEKGHSGEYRTSHLLRLFSSMWMEH